MDRILIAKTHDDKDVVICDRTVGAHQATEKYREIIRHQTNEDFKEISLCELRPIRPVVRRLTKTEYAKKQKAAEELVKKNSQTAKQREAIAKKEAKSSAEAKTKANKEKLVFHNAINDRIRTGKPGAVEKSPKAPETSGETKSNETSETTK